LAGINCNIQCGECVAVLGPSGSGKSTLLYILGGVDTPTSGEVWLDDVELTKLPESVRTLLRRRRLGFIFQSFNLLPNLNVLDNVALPLILDGVWRREARARAQAALESVSMVHRTTQLPTQLSGGEQQRVAIARALIIEPLLLFADEPTGNLDTTNGQRVITLLRKLADGRRRAVVIVTHDSQIATCADRALVLVDGQIHYDGPAKAENWYDILQQRPNA
jgi:putative ABC transport system ATP-binding protein